MPSEFEKNGDEATEGIDVLEVMSQEAEQKHQEYIAARCAESRRTPEWAETSWKYKIDHYECEFCGGTSDIETHDILPYRLLTEGQRRDCDFLLKQNFISLCRKHHLNVAHRGDPKWIKFNPRIREIAERRLRHKHGRW